MAESNVVSTGHATEIMMLVRLPLELTCSRTAKRAEYKT